jgi:hypothetical protein
MRGVTFAVFLVCATAVCSQSDPSDATISRVKKSRTYAAEGFEPVFCFAGQVKVEGKRLSRRPFSVSSPDEDRRCCGPVLKTAQTDQHGHFLVEPLPEGRYFAKFKSNGSEDLVSFAVVRSYDRCDGSHLEINFSKAGKATIQDHIDINDSGEPCQASEPLCYRK